MKKICLSIFIFLTILVGNSRAAALRESVVKVFTTANPIDYYHPWQSKGSEAATGSGCVIAGNKILTNAHVVSDQTFIEVKRYSDPKRYTARLVAIGHDCDLALLEVDDPNFFKGITPIEIGELPNLQDVVQVVGFPTGGEEISITQGVVSRIEVTKYVHSAALLLTVQIDAAVNPGNSGGPALKDGKLIGIAMQVVPYAQNIGYIIPTPIINHFLADLKDGKYDGFPKLGIEFAKTESPSLREFYKINNLTGGVYVTRVMKNSSASGYLKEGDVILEINGTPIGEDGTFAFRDTQRLLLSHLIATRQIGDQLTMKIIRDGESKTISFTLNPYTPLVLWPYAVPRPSYYIYGGMIFTVLSADLLWEWRNNWEDKPYRAPVDFSYYYYGIGRLNEDSKKEIVVLLDVLPDAVNVGYHSYENMVMERVNGQEFNSFQDFVKLLNTKTGPYTILETKDRQEIILKNDHIDDIDQEICKRNNIPSRFSSDVEAWVKEDQVKAK